MKKNILTQLLFALFPITVFLSSNVYAQNQNDNVNFQRISEANANLMTFAKKMNTDQNYFLDYIQFKEMVCAEKLNHSEKKKLLSIGNKLSMKSVKEFSDEIGFKNENKSGRNYIYNVYDAANLPKKLMDDAAIKLSDFSFKTDDIINQYEDCNSKANSKEYEADYINVVNSITKLHRAGIMTIIKPK